MKERVFFAAMSADLPSDDSLDPASTGRMARHLSVVAQLEAALLAHRLSVESPLEATGTDPYNHGPARREPWRSRR